MDNVILISGGSEGIGKAMATSLSKGNRVIITARKEEDLKAVAAEIGCEYLVGDVTIYADNERIVQTILAKHGRLDVLINNAGLWIQGKLVDNDPVQIEQVMKVNALGTILLTRAVLPTLLSQKQGQVITINSQGGLMGKTERSVYNASKWALTGFMRSLQEELKGSGIKVINIYPSLIATELFSKAGIERDMSSALQPEDIAGLVKFIVAMRDQVYLPDVGIKHTDY